MSEDQVKDPGTISNPGSIDAKKLGCLCPVMDNNHGKWPPFPAGTAWGGDKGGWYVAGDCPVHAVAAADA